VIIIGTSYFRGIPTGSDTLPSYEPFANASDHPPPYDAHVSSGGFDRPPSGRPLRVRCPVCGGSVGSWRWSVLREIKVNGASGGPGSGKQGACRPAACWLGGGVRLGVPLAWPRRQPDFCRECWAVPREVDTGFHAAMGISVAL
jgi:hypothetical protein